jgi:hypothetical protein
MILSLQEQNKLLSAISRGDMGTLESFDQVHLGFHSDTSAFHNLSAHKAFEKFFDIFPNYILGSSTVVCSSFDSNIAAEEAGDDSTFLMCCAERGDVKSMKYLLQRGVDVHVINAYGNTALHFASWGVGDDESLAECVELLLQNGIDPNVKNNELSTALHECCTTSRSPERVVKLLNAGADPRSLDILKRSPLNLAAGYGSLQALNILLKYGVHDNGGLLTRDRFGRNPLGTACWYRNIECAVRLIQVGVPLSINERRILHRRLKWNTFNVDTIYWEDNWRRRKCFFMSLMKKQLKRDSDDNIDNEEKEEKEEKKDTMNAYSLLPDIWKQVVLYL